MDKQRFIQCTAPDCERRAHARGLCSSHYGRRRRNGNTEGVRLSPGTAVAAIFERFLPSVEDTCLAWPFNRDKHGYGRVRYKGRTVLAHRLICELSKGPPPAPSLEAAHSCGNGHLGCVNPRHLNWATRSENMAEMVAHGRSMKGDRHPAARLTADSVRAIRKKLHVSSVKELSAEYRVDPQTIRRIKWGASWSNVR